MTNSFVENLTENTWKNLTIAALLFRFPSPFQDIPPYRLKNKLTRKINGFLASFFLRLFVYL